MAKRTIGELHQMQSLPLDAKIQMTRRRIKGWIDEFGEDGVYVSFSGGKDSTVLLDIVRKDYPDVVGVFVDTGLEYPEIREFVKTFDNITWLKPKLSFKQVIEKYGYPIISKQQAQYIYEYRHAKTDRMKQYRTRGGFGSVSQKYLFLLDAPFEITHQCCNVMKKNPLKKYEKETSKKPIIGTMASESYVRTQKWIENGCNAFDLKRPVSNPMSFWTEQDVLMYARINNIAIPSVYGDIVEQSTENIEGQLCFEDVESWKSLGLFENERPCLTTTGCLRTGCMFCMFGCTHDNLDNFTRIKQTHPKIYEYIMKPTSEGGLGYKEIIDWINEHGNLNIKY